MRCAVSTVPGESALWASSCASFSTVAAPSHTVQYWAATGRPFTPVAGAAFDSARALYVPTYGAPNSERFPAFRRLDLSVSRTRPLGAERLLVAAPAAPGTAGPIDGTKTI